jgi:GT2 family glycosyltransferase
MARLATPRGRRRAALERVHALPARPLISVVMPTYETDPRLLRAAIGSMRAQSYPDWQLCIADDGSRSPKLRRALERASRDSRIEVAYLERNSGISAATNAAMALAEGEFVAFLDHDDVLSADALLRVAQALGDDPELDVVYSDSDKLTAHGVRADPFLKPDWSPAYALGAMYIGHLLVVRRTVAERAGGFDPRFDKIQDFEFMLRVSELTERIHHIPEILYHWRAVPGSIAAGAEQKPGVGELQAQAVSAHLRRIGAAAIAVPHHTIPHRARLARDPSRAIDPAELAASVSVVIVARRNDERLAGLLDSLFEISAHPPGEVIVVAAEPERAAAVAAGHPVRIVADDLPDRSRAQAANRGAAAAGGEWLAFCSDHAEIVEPGWLADLHLHASLPGVAAAGPLLARPDGLTEAAGFALALDHPVEPMLAGVDADADGYYGSLACARDVSAISAEFMLIRRAAFEQAGGFEPSFATGFEDFDLCQRLRELGQRVVYAPTPRVVIHETPAARREALDVVDRALFVDRWYDRLADGDPFFNPNFERTEASFVPRPEGVR